MLDRGGPLSQSQVPHFDNRFLSQATAQKRDLGLEHGNNQNSRAHRSESDKNMIRLKTNFSKTKLLKRRLRTASGAYLLELIVAMFVSGMMALALTTSLTQGMSSSRGSQNQVLATWLAHQAMDRIKMSADQANVNHAFSSQNRIFDVPSPSVLQFKLTSNDPNPVQPYDFVQRPLMFDFSTLKWNNEDSLETVPKNFNGTVQALIEDRLDSGKNIEITVTWIDSNGTGQKRYSIKGAVFKQ